MEGQRESAASRSQSELCRAYDKFLVKEIAREARRRISRREKDLVVESLGLVKVRGNLGGIYYE